MTIKVQSRKQKGRNLQKAVVRALLEKFDSLLEEDDVKSCSMGAGGEDVILSPLARRIIRCSFECKAQEAFSSLAQAYDQAVANSKSAVPVCVIKTNRHKPMAVLDLDTFISMLHLLHFHKSDWDQLI